MLSNLSVPLHFFQKTGFFVNWTSLPSPSPNRYRRQNIIVVPRCCYNQIWITHWQEPPIREKSNESWQMGHLGSKSKQNPYPEKPDVAIHTTWPSFPRLQLLAAWPLLPFQFYLPLNLHRSLIQQSNGSLTFSKHMQYIPASYHLHLKMQCCPFTTLPTNWVILQT